MTMTESRFDEIHCGVRQDGRTITVTIQLPTESSAEEHAAEIGRQIMAGHLYLEVEMTPILGSA